MHTHTHACMHTHMHACTHTHTHACMHTHTRMHARMHAHTHTHAHTHARTHTCTHTLMCVCLAVFTFMNLTTFTCQVVIMIRIPTLCCNMNYSNWFTHYKMSFGSEELLKYTRDCQSHGDVHHVQEGRRGGGLSSIGSLRATSQGTGIPPQPLPQSSCLIAMATNGTTSDTVH